jgi:hypothetical protein
MRRTKNSCVYTGRVGAKMRPVAHRVAKHPVRREVIRATGGPLDGRRLRLEMNTGLSTLPFTLAGQTGRYLKGIWEAAA